MESTPGTPPTSPSAAAAAAADFRKMPMAEKILAVAAVAGIVGFLVSHGFDFFFKVWHLTTLFIGSVIVLALIGTKLFRVALMGPKAYTNLLVVAAVLPALGMVIDSFDPMEYFIVLASTVLMAYAGAKITTRENILKR